MTYQEHGFGDIAGIEFETELWSCKMVMPLEEFEKSGGGTNFTAKMIN